MIAWVIAGMEARHSLSLVTLTLPSLHSGAVTARGSEYLASIPAMGLMWTHRCIPYSKLHIITVFGLENINFWNRWLFFSRKPKWNNVKCWLLYCTEQYSCTDSVLDCTCMVTYHLPYWNDYIFFEHILYNFLWVNNFLYTV